MSASKCRWGFLGAAAIARKNWKAIEVSGNGRVAAVASRSIDRARDFIAECSAEVPPCGDVVAYGSYEELIASDDIDAIYIPLPTGIRKSWVIKAAQAGKHVLCEKPVAVNSADCQEMIDACNAAGVQFMDGVMFDHSARLAGIRESLSCDSGFGQLRRISTHFSFCGDESFAKSNIRADSVLEPHGCLGDLGWYCIRFTLWVMQDQLPTHVSSRILSTIRSDDGTEVPSEMSAELWFDGDVTATFFCSFLTSNQQTALVSGTNGYVAMDDFVLPFYDAELKWTENAHLLEIDNCRWNFGAHRTPKSVHEYAGGESNSQEVNMVRRLSEIVSDGKLDARFPDIAIKTQQILDACRKSAAADGQRVAVG